MNRRQFLQRVGVALAGLGIGAKLPESQIDEAPQWVEFFPGGFRIDWGQIPFGYDWGRDLVFNGIDGIYVSLHTGDGPGQTGANEVSGNGYKRQEVFFGSVDGLVANTERVDFPHLPRVTITSLGIWAGPDFILGMPMSRVTETWPDDTFSFERGNLSLWYS